MAENEVKKREYQERYHFWSEKKISQLSFHNNLLLTIGFAVIGYFWSERRSIYTELALDFDAQIDWLVVSFLTGIAFAVVSVVSGFLLSLSRLYDLRITSNIILTRKRALKKSVKLMENNTSDSGFMKSLKALVVISWNYKNYEIKKTEIDETDEFRNKFIELRQKASDLGTSTWVLVRWQTLCMLIAFIFFALTLALK